MKVSCGYHNLYLQWRVADAKASAAEREVAARIVKAIDRKVHPPGLDAWETSKQLRGQADKLLDELKAAIHIERADRRGRTRSTSRVNPLARELRG
jgi:hypothetical protein